MAAHGLQRARWLRNKSLQNRRRRKRRVAKSRSVPSGEAVSVVAVESEAMNYSDIEIDLSLGLGKQDLMRGWDFGPSLH